MYTQTIDLLLIFFQNEETFIKETKFVCSSVSYSKGYDIASTNMQQKFSKEKKGYFVR